MCMLGGGDVVDLLSNFCSWVKKMTKSQIPLVWWSWWGRGRCLPTLQLLSLCSKLTKSQISLCWGGGYGIIKGLLMCGGPSWAPVRGRLVLSHVMDTDTKFVQTRIGLIPHKCFIPEVFIHAVISNLLLKHGRCNLLLEVMNENVIKASILLRSELAGPICNHFQRR